jgi:hypothetical protein
MYLDESGCQLWSPVSYSYSRSGEQKRLEQTDRRKGRISILGLWQPDKSFKYAWLVVVSKAKVISGSSIGLPNKHQRLSGPRTHDSGSAR